MRYELFRSKRKTLALSVDRNGLLTVRAPLRMPVAQIESFVQEKSGWIENAKARMALLPPPLPRLELSDGASLPYFGGTLTLRLAPVAKLRLEGDVLLVPHSVADLTPVLRWLDAQARADFTVRVRRLSQLFGLHPKTLRLSHARGRWGSMSTRGTLSLNRSLILCPPGVIDYVIIHELCHIAFPNHSGAFWDRVERCLPGYRVKRDWLKANNSLIYVLPG